MMEVIERSTQSVRLGPYCRFTEKDNGPWNPSVREPGYRTVSRRFVTKGVVNTFFLHGHSYTRTSSMAVCKDTDF